MERLIGIKLYHFEELDSTNDYASQLIAKNKPIEGTVIIADHQTQGKGQYGRKWSAEAKLNLTMSVILYPQLNVDRQFDLNIISSLAICECLKTTYRVNAKIKWPNDIYVQDKKICGILIKNNLMGQYIHQSIIGIGLNVNQDRFDPTIPNPTSLKAVLNETIDLKSLRQNLFRTLDKYYSMLTNERHQLLDLYHNKLYKIDTIISYLKGDKIFSGMLRGVSQEGQILIQHLHETKAFNLSEIKLII